MKLQDILRKIKKADEDYHMIQAGDRIAVGVSGGRKGRLSWKRSWSRDFYMIFTESC